MRRMALSYTRTRACTLAIAKTLNALDFYQVHLFKGTICLANARHKQDTIIYLLSSLLLYRVLNDRFW